MKISNVRFLAKNNLKGNTKSNAILVLMILLVISLTLVSSFSLTVSSAVNEFKNDSRARMLIATCDEKIPDKKTIESIKKIKHVESVTVISGMRDDYFKIDNLFDNNQPNKNQQNNKVFKDKESATISVITKLDSQIVKPVNGKSLEDSKAFSCLVPDIYNFTDEDSCGRNVPHYDGNSLIGKTLSLKVSDDTLHFAYSYNDSSNMNSGNTLTDELFLPKIKLNVVGTYRCKPNAMGGYDVIFISNDTGNQILKQALISSGYDMNSKTEPIIRWYNNDYLKDHYILVDDYDNLDYVANKISEMKIRCNEPDYALNDAVLILSNIISIAGAFFVFAIVLLCIINLIHSSVNNVTKRKGEIGLLKASGYTNRQVFVSLFYEQLIITIKGLIIGGCFSAVVILISNFIFNNTTYINRMYVISWGNYAMLLGISAILAIVVPLVCQFILLHKLNLISPKDAMSES